MRGLRRKEAFLIGPLAALWHTPSSFSREEESASLHSWGAKVSTGTCTNKGEPDAKETFRDGSGCCSGRAGGCARAIRRPGVRHGSHVSQPDQVRRCHDKPGA